jgi:hypothetical protein
MCAATEGIGINTRLILSNIVNCNAGLILPLVLKRASGNGLRLFLTHNLTHEGKFGGGDETVGEDEGFLWLRTKTGRKVYNDLKMLEMVLYLASRPIGKDEVPGSNPGNSSKNRAFSLENARFLHFVP